MSSSKLMRLVKVFLFRFNIALVLLMDCFVAKSRKPMKVGFITCEYFNKKMRGFGGFGMTVKNIVDYFNSEGSPFCFSVMINKKNEENVFKERLDNVDIIFEYKEARSLRVNAFKQFEYLNNIRNEKFNFIMTIEYYKAYEYLIQHTLALPLLIWIHDPRTEHDWKRVGSVEMEAKIQMGTDTRAIESKAQDDQASIHKVIKLGKLLKKKIAFAHQAHFLLEKARDLYGLPNLESIYLPNPIPLINKTFKKSTNPSVIFLGRLDAVKRPWIFFEMAKRFPAVEFKVAGVTHFPNFMNPIIENYKKLPNLNFLGLIQGEEKWKEIGSSWIMMNTSIHEALPVSYLEGLMLKTPLVGGNVDPDNLVTQFGVYAGEFWGDGKNEETTNAFANALGALLENTQLRNEKAKAGREYVFSNHSFSRFKQNIEKIYESIA